MGNYGQFRKPRGKGFSYTNDQVLKAMIKLKENGMDIVNTSRQTGISTATLKKWVSGRGEHYLVGQSEADKNDHLVNNEDDLKRKIAALKRVSIIKLETAIKSERNALNLANVFKILNSIDTGVEEKEEESPAVKIEKRLNENRKLTEQNDKAEKDQKG